jgi:hypothetical protein
VFNALRHDEVLTLSRDYFRLRKPIERRIYELARKHCGRQPAWRISLALLQKKCGAVSSPREFRRLMTNIIDEDRRFAHIPDYSVDFESDDMVVFRNRGAMPPIAGSGERDDIRLSAEAYHDARTVAPGWDVYMLEQEWKQWISEPPRDADAAFIGFCRKWY